MRLTADRRPDVQKLMKTGPLQFHKVNAVIGGKPQTQKIPRALTGRGWLGNSTMQDAGRNEKFADL